MEWCLCGWAEGHTWGRHYRQQFPVSKVPRTHRLCAWRKRRGQTSESHSPVSLFFCWSFVLHMLRCRCWNVAPSECLITRYRLLFNHTGNASYQCETLNVPRLHWSLRCIDLKFRCLYTLGLFYFLLCHLSHNHMSLISPLQCFLLILPPSSLESWWTPIHHMLLCVSQL